MLEDDGGLGLDHASSWIREGIARVDAVLSGSRSSNCWDRETWGAEFSPLVSTVYSLLDENCRESLPTPVFRLVLERWLEFLESDVTSSEVVLNLAT
jgi:hypothetical protein